MMKIPHIACNYWGAIAPNLLGEIKLILPHTPAITLHQPWATLIAMGIKKYETTDWDSQHYGSLLIHASSKKPNTEALAAIASESGNNAILDWDYPTGAIIAIADLVDTIQMTPDFIDQQSKQEYAAGLWFPGRYAWKLGRIQKVPAIPAKGSRGLWEPGEEIVSKIQFYLWEERKAVLTKTEETRQARIEQLKTSLTKEQKKLQKTEKQKKPDALEVSESKKRIVRLTRLIREIEIWEQLEISKEYCIGDRNVILEDKFFTTGDFPSVWVSEVGSDDKWVPYFPSQLNQ